MLKPSMQDLMKRVNNRYLLVNLAAQRARDISAREEAARENEPKDRDLKDLSLEKPIKIALDEICEDKIEYRPGPKPEPENTEVILAAAAASEEADSELLAEEDDDLMADETDDETEEAEEL